MTGYFRFFLANLVILTHLKFYLFDFIVIGWGAVFGFYILAGVVTSKIFIEIFKKDIKSYLIDRTLRIYPVALFFIFFGILIVEILDPRVISLDFKKLCLSAFLIPQNYFYALDLNMINKEFAFDDNYHIWGQYFALGLEFQAYILLAIFLKYLSFNNLRVIAIFSFLIYALFTIFGVSEVVQVRLNFTYVSLVGVFFCFYLGVLIYHKKHKEYFIWYFIFFSLYLFVSFRGFGFGSSESTLFGLLIFMPIILFLYGDIYNKKIKFNSFFGSMSFIVYCNHFLMIYIVKILFNLDTIEFSFSLYMGVFVGSLGIGVPIYFLIEKPLENFRKKIGY